jgi:hypothetical protein
MSALGLSKEDPNFVVCKLHEEMQWPKRSVRMLAVAEKRP